MPRSRRRSRVARQAKFLPRGFNDSAVWVVAGRALEILPLTNLVGIGDFQQLLHLTMAAGRPESATRTLVGAPPP